MINAFLWQTFHRLLRETELKTPRFLIHALHVKDRLTGVIGARGVGKTTLLLQFIKKHFTDKKNAFYFSADNTYFNERSILDFVSELHTFDGIDHFFIDEIHKYANWNQELKNIYDSFPKVKVMFSGSSSIDLVHGSYDLSRRAKLLFLPGLSFREYLNMKLQTSFESIDFETLLMKHSEIAADLASVSTVAAHFAEYCAFGYYPIVFEDRENLYSALDTIIDKTIYEDIANFYHLKTQNLSQFRRILNFLSSIPPGEVKVNTIASHLQIDNKTAEHYLFILEKTGLTRNLLPVAHGHQTLTKPAKIYMENTTLLAASNAFLSQPLEIGTQRELAFLQLTKGAKLPVFYPKTLDFQIQDRLFEVGGKNKTRQQMEKGKANQFLVKDNIVFGARNEIPLYLFGFLY